MRPSVSGSSERAEYLQEKGMVDKVVPRSELPETLGKLLSMLMDGRRVAA